MLLLLLVLLQILLQASANGVVDQLCTVSMLDASNQHTFVVLGAVFSAPQNPFAGAGFTLCEQLASSGVTAYYQGTLDLYNPTPSAINFSRLTSMLSACQYTGSAFMNGPSLSGSFCYRAASSWTKASWSDCVETSYVSPSTVPYICALVNTITVTTTELFATTIITTIPTLTSTTRTSTTTSITLFVPTTTTSTSIVSFTTSTSTTTTTTEVSKSTSTSRTTTSTTGTSVEVIVDATTESSTVELFTETTTTITVSSISSTVTTDTLYTCPSS